MVSHAREFKEAVRSDEEKQSYHWLATLVNSNGHHESRKRAIVPITDSRVREFEYVLRLEKGE